MTTNPFNHQRKVNLIDTLANSEPLSELAFLSNEQVVAECSNLLTSKQQRAAFYFYSAHHESIFKISLKLALTRDGARGHLTKASLNLFEKYSDHTSVQELTRRAQQNRINIYAFPACAKA